MSYILDPYTRKCIAERFVTRGYHTDELIAALNGDDLALLELLGQLDRKPKGEVHRGQVFVTTYYLTQDKYPEIPSEHHDDETQIIHVTTGELEVTIDDSKTTVGKGDIIEIPRGSEHRVVTRAPESRAWSTYPRD